MSSLRHKQAQVKPVKTSSDIEGFGKQKYSDRMEKARLDFLLLFKNMSDKVPAYSSFLKKMKFDTRNVKVFSDIKNIPHTNKDNYIKPSLQKDTFWGGNMTTGAILTSTSGSTGDPTYFARNLKVDEQASVIHELFFNSSGLNKNCSTLVIVCFGMGVWIGGLITYQAFRNMSQKGYPLSIITPGINQKEIIKVLKDIAHEYDQVILAGYPPFLKDIVDIAKTEKILPFKKTKLSLLFAAEVFSENFRKYISNAAGVESEVNNTMNIYGSADLGAMAFETPMSIAIRKLALENESLFKDIFGDIKKLPTLTQFIPSYVYFEEENGELLISGDSSMPLMRYEIGDYGGVLDFDNLVSILEKHNITINHIKENFSINNILELPFVYVYERKDMSTTLYGLQIFTEHVRDVLLRPEFSNSVTGKLSMSTVFDDKQNQCLEINIELKEKINRTKALEKSLQLEIFNSLREKSSEFRELSDFIKDQAAPRIVSWEFNHPLHFQKGIKQKWVKKM